MKIDGQNLITIDLTIPQWEYLLGVMRNYQQRGGLDPAKAAKVGKVIRLIEAGLKAQEN